MDAVSATAHTEEARNYWHGEGDGDDDCEVIFRIRKQATEVLQLAKTRAHVDIELDEATAEAFAASLETHVKQLVFDAHASKEFFNRTIPREVVDSFFTPSVRRSESGAPVSTTLPNLSVSHCDASTFRSV